MNNFSIQQLCHINKPVYIWGARALGCGVLRLVQRENLNIKGFIDSDKAFKDRKILGYHVYPPTHLKENFISEKPYVIIASSTSEYTISRLCEQMGMRKFSDFCTSSEICGVEYIIDIVGACNLACPSCPRGNYPDQPSKGIMSLKKYEKVIEKILEESPNVSMISLYNWGEPLLHPQLQDFITIQKNKKIFSSVSTNFNIKNNIKSLVSAKLDMLKVSVSGYFQKNYGVTHFKGDINLVKSNLYKLRYFMDKVNSEMEVEIIYHKYRNNTGNDLEKFRSLAQELGFSFAEIFAYYNPVEKVIDYLEGRGVDKDMQLIEELFISIDEAISNTEKTEKRLCPLKENQVVINWNGSVSLCCACYDPKKTIIADDFLDIPLNEILSLKHKNTLCKTCMDYGIDQYYFDTSQRTVEKNII